MVLFGIKIRRNNMDTLVNIKVRQSTREMLKVGAKKKGLTLNDYILELIKGNSNGIK